MMRPPPLLDVRALRCGHGRRTVLADISFTLRRGEILCLLGPNGIGKTTLFKTLLRLLPAQGGSVRLDGEDVAGWSRRRFATRVGYVPQSHMPAFPFLVRDLVAMGRTAHLDPLSSPGPHDVAVAERMLDGLGIAHLGLRPSTEISGGERQLVLLARALAQEPVLLMLDEPTSNLDFGNQARVLDHLDRLARERELAVVMTTHDPNQALLRASRVAALDRHGAFAIGEPAALITETYLRDTYGVAARVAEIPGDGNHRLRVCLPCHGDRR